MSEGFWRWATLAPALAVLALMTAAPVGELLAMSLHEITWSGGEARWRFVGAANYAALADDALFRAGVANTVAFALAGVAVQMTLGFGLALLTSRALRGQLAWRAVFLLPILVPGIVVGAIWKLMYNPDFGIINQLVASVGLSPRDWLGERATALPAIVAVNVWHWTPFCYLLLLAALESLPQDVREAATVDGASAWQELRHVTLPLMAPAIAVTAAFRLIVAFKVFDEVYLLTGGGPGTATEVVSFSVYRRFFTEDRAGYGSALSIATLFAMALAIVIALSATRRRGASA
jgi:multiple sugar transport system permease protein